MESFPIQYSEDACGKIYSDLKQDGRFMINGTFQRHRNCVNRENAHLIAMKTALQLLAF